MSWSIAETVGSTADAAFAVSSGNRIVAWNEAAERILGFPARCVLGKPCHEVLKGADLSGNAYCRANCPILSMVRRRQAVSSFEVLFRDRSGQRVPVEVAAFAVNGQCTGEPIVIHLLRPLDDSDLMRRSTSRTAEPDPDYATRLTSRQLEILRLVANGCGTAAIAGLLHISQVTVRNHVEAVLHRLEVHSRLEAIAVARRAGLL